MYKRSKFFYCYSTPIKRFLMERDHRYISIGINPTTMMKYWLFERDNDGKLTDDINEWFEVNKK